jgi:pimeloyl-ACP methyl ester carboxylesterase
MLMKSMLVAGVTMLAWLIFAPGCMTFRTTDETAVKKFSRKGIELKTATYQVNGTDIHYVMVGTDTLPTLILVHGTPGSWGAFEDYLEDPALLLHYRVVSVDRPGFGYSNFGQAMNLADQSVYLMPLLREIHNDKPVFLAGHSLGGPLVVKMAADNPEAFQGIMLISGSVDPALEPKESWRYVAEKFPFRLFLPGAFKPSNTELVYFKKDVVDLAGDFSKVSCDVYLVHGAKDSWVPVGNVDYARKKLVHARRVETMIIPDGNHFIPFTRRAQIVDALIGMGNK